MATPASPNTVSSASEAFQHPLPVVRQFRKDLQAALDEKNGRLRMLVGGSYRQLLGTAEMIVQMRADIEAVEVKLGRVAEGCARSMIAKRVSGLGKLGTTSGREDLEWVAKMKVLSGSVMVVGWLLSGKGASKQDSLPGQSKAKGLVAAAKVLVLARLLMKSLKEMAKNGECGVDGVAKLVEETRKKLGGLRRRLLRSVDSVLEKIDCEKDNLAQALCAYSLATSSGANDALRHFLQVRGEAMVLAFEEGEGQLTKEQREANMLQALGLYTGTLLNVQALAPKRLSDALLSLKAKPLLEDDTLQKLESLRLDVSMTWFGDEILYFTPYIRHDDLSVALVTETLKSWAKRASTVLLQGFKEILEQMTDFITLVELRTKVFEKWICEGGKAKGFDSSVILYGLREVVNSCMVDILERQISKLQLVGTEIEATITSWESSLNDQQRSLWAEELLDIDLQGGASLFKQEVTSHVYGRDSTVSRAVNCYKTWRHQIDELLTAIEQLRGQKWDEDLESLEDDDILERRKELLSKDDPEMLQIHLDTSLQKSCQDLHQKVASLLSAHMKDEYIGGIAIYVLRVLRDIRAELPKCSDLTSFGLSLIPTLHSVLASTTTAVPISIFITSVSDQKKLVGRALWEGTPELPVQPSPSTFKLLYGITSSMVSAGNDLWSPTAVKVLRRHSCHKISQEWIDALEQIALEDEPHVNGAADKMGQSTGNESETSDETQSKTEACIGVPPNTNADKRRDILIQALFDICVLQHSLFLSTDGEDDHKDSNLSNLLHFLRERLDLLESSEKRLKQGAKEYWKRTSLLFGLLS